MNVAGCACLLGARFAPVTVSANTDAPAPYWDIESPPARERKHLDVPGRESGALVPASSTRRPSWRSNRPAFTSYPSPGAAPT